MRFLTKQNITKLILVALVLVMIASLSISCKKPVYIIDVDDDETSAPTSLPTTEPGDENVDYTLKKIMIADMDGNYKSQGRTEEVRKKIQNYDEKQTVLTLNHTADTFEFNACCQGNVSIEMFTRQTQGDMYFTIWVDGVRTEDRNEGLIPGDSRGTRSYVIAEGLTAGRHTFKIARQNESERGEIYIASISIEGELRDAPANSNLYIQFIGDSITAGIGNLYPDLTGGATGDGELVNCYQDGTRTYAFKTLEALGADYDIVAQQGLGTKIGWITAFNGPMMYEKTCYQLDTTTDWTFERKADIVVINLGTNDVHGLYTAGWCTEAEEKDAMRLLLTEIRNHNPNAKIVWMYGMMSNDTRFENIVTEIMNEKGGESAGYYTLFTDPQPTKGAGHPYVTGHDYAAEKLIAKLNSILGK